MTKQDIIDYVVTTPHNPNKAVLSTMLDGLGAGDNKTEIELLAQENKVYMPAENKVYNKVTVNVPLKEEIELYATHGGTFTPDEGKVYNKVIINVSTPSYYAYTIDLNGGTYGTDPLISRPAVDGTIFMPSLWWDNNYENSVTPPAGKTYVGLTTVKDDASTLVTENFNINNFVLLYVLWEDE